MAFSLLNKIEKRVVLILFVIAVISGPLIVRQHFYRNELPVFGGTFIEGTLANSDSDLSESLGRLTKIGLTKFDSKGNIIPDLAESWQISPDGLTYIFKLRNIVKSDEAITRIRGAEKEWADINISKIDDSQIKFELKQPLGPFLAHTTEPIFDYGPYKQTKIKKTEIELEANNDYWEGKPYISKVVLKLYADPKALETAVKNKKVMGALLPTGNNIKNYHVINISLPKYKMVFFNTSNSILSDKSLRQKIAQDQNIGKKIDLNMAVANNENDLQIAADISEKWSKIGINLAISPYSATELQKNIIPNHDYDLILYGINYGAEEDPYPFFHSSQTSADGLNLSSFSNSQADKLLEEARFTTDAEGRKKKYEEFKKFFSDEVPAIVVAQENMKYFISDTVNGSDADPYSITAGDRFYNVAHLYIKTKRVR